MYPILENRPVWIDIDLEQFGKNLAYIKAKAADKEIWAVVKSDAYNHGIDGLFVHFIAAGITHFCVGNYDEAVQLQALADDANEDIMLLIFGVVPRDKILTLPENWSVTISDLQTAQIYTKVLAEDTNKRVGVQVKIDSGMNRRGFKEKAAFEAAMALLESNVQFELVGLYTHFSTSDTDVAFMQKQVQRFLDMSEGKRDKFRYIHAQNSHGLLNLGEAANIFNVLRLGGICYGLTGAPHETLLPIFQLYGDIIEKKAVQKGETISYGNTHTFADDGYVGVIPLGYADGWRKINTNLTVYVGGKACQIVGRICMEQLMIFATDDIFSVGDTVEFIGAQSSVFAVAQHDEITDYELICSFVPRMPKRYR